MKKIYSFPFIIFLISVGISQNKINVNNLFKHRNKYFKENDYVPYDGIAFDISKETRNKILQFRIHNGIKNGTYEEWYSNAKPKTTGEYFNDDSTDSWIKWYESGQKQSEKNYKNGKKDGLWIKWYESGQKQSEKNYKNGKKDGPWIKWYGNGLRRKEVTYKNNNLDGLFYQWYENGQKEIEGTYKVGKKDGSWIEWYENGQKEIESSFQDGKERGLVNEWYENGLKREERTFKQFITYTENGLKRNREIYKRLFTYYDTGNKKEERNYRNGEEWGLRILYHDNGIIKYKNANFKKNGDDKTSFIFARYDINGKLIEGDKKQWDGFDVKSGECYKNNEKVDCYAPN